MTERQNIEWKRSWQDEYLKWIRGFANAQGGSIFIGKSDDGTVYGLTNAKKLLQDIPGKAIRFEGIHRIEDPPYPTAALREVFLNALVHRRYMSSTVQARIYDDKMTVWNEGPIPHEIKDLNAPHASVPRNRLIADICFKAGYIDSWGRGIEKITNTCTEHGCPRPTFEITPMGVLVTLAPKFSMAPQVTPQDGTSRAPVTAPLGPNGEPSQHQVEAHEASSNPTSSHQVTQQVRDLLKSLDGEMTRLEIMASLKLKDRVNFTKNYLKPVLENSLVEMTQPNSPNSPTQKYRKSRN